MGPVRNALRLTLPLLVAIAAVAVGVSVVTTRTTRAWFEAELTTRARLAASSARQAILEAQGARNQAQLTRLLDDLLRDDRVVAAAICNTDEKMLARTALYPRTGLSCNDVQTKTAGRPGGAGTRSSVITLGSGEAPLHISVTPIVDETGPRAELVVVQDFAQVHQRQELVRMWALAILGTLALASSLVTILSARLTSVGWVRQLTRALRGERDRWRDDSPLLENVRAMAQRTTAAALEADRDGRWTRERLRSALIEHLDEDALIIVANREPYIHERRPDGHIEVQHPASGLVTALEPVMRACSGTWIAHGSGSADRATSDVHSRLAVPPGEGSYMLRRVWMTEEEEQGYYYGMSNEGLWPLCHQAYARPIFRADDWHAYREINMRFADAVASEVTVDDPIILVQDYHFALAPRFIRERLPRATIITFWHIPWPNAERLGIFPWREE
ncbi:MAG: trehalose-6-phosphate synthase, partial [Gemmatimonadaceae bacterium]